MRIHSNLPLLPRLMQPWHLALVIALLVGVFMPQPALAASTWTTVALMNTARFYHTATLLPGGKVLVAGGMGNSSALSSVEVYGDPGAASLLFSCR